MRIAILKTCLPNSHKTRPTIQAGYAQGENFPGHYLVLFKAARNFHLESELFPNLPDQTRRKILKKVQAQEQG